MQLLVDGEKAAVVRAREGTPPEGWNPRMDWELLRAAAEVMVPRTIAIDEAIRERINPQVVILGAGLDGRAWRMQGIADVAVFEVDHPASQKAKRERAEGISAVVRDVRFVPVDFGRDALDTSLKSYGHDPAIPTTWVWEGVVPYLTRAEVESTAAIVGMLSAAGSRLIVNYQAPSLAAALGRRLMRSMMRMSRRPDPLAGEPTRSTWSAEAMQHALLRAGFTVLRDTDLMSVAQELERPINQRASLRNGRVAVADR